MKHLCIFLLIVIVSMSTEGRNINVQFGSTYTGDGFWNKGTVWSHVGTSRSITNNNLPYADGGVSPVGIVVSSPNGSFSGGSTFGSTPTILINSSGVYTPLHITVTNLNSAKTYSLVTYHTNKGGGITMIIASGINSVTGVVNTVNSGADFVMGDNVGFMSSITPKPNTTLDIMITNGWKGVSAFQILEGVYRPHLSAYRSNGNLVVEWLNNIDAQLAAETSDALTNWGTSSYTTVTSGITNQIVINSGMPTVTQQFFRINMSP
jgi:hypothetical protein